MRHILFVLTCAALLVFVGEWVADHAATTPSHPQPSRLETGELSVESAEAVGIREEKVRGRSGHPEVSSGGERNGEVFASTLSSRNKAIHSARYHIPGLSHLPPSVSRAGPGSVPNEARRTTYDIDSPGRPTVQGKPAGL